MRGCAVVRPTAWPARDDQLVAAGVAADPAESLVAMLDGLVLDAILRGRPDVDLTLWQIALAAALKPHT